MLSWSFVFKGCYYLPVICFQYDVLDRTSPKIHLISVFFAKFAFLPQVSALSPPSPIVSKPQSCSRYLLPIFSPQTSPMLPPSPHQLPTRLRMLGVFTWLEESRGQRALMNYTFSHIVHRSCWDPPDACPPDLLLLSLFASLNMHLLCLCCCYSSVFALSYLIISEWVTLLVVMESVLWKNCIYVSIKIMQ